MILLLTLIVSIYAGSVELYSTNPRVSYIFCDSAPKNPINSYFCTRFFDYFEKGLYINSESEMCENCANAERDMKQSGNVDTVISRMTVSFCETFREKTYNDCVLWRTNNLKELKHLARTSVKEGKFCNTYVNCSPKDVTKFLSYFKIENNEIPYPLCETCILMIREFEDQYLGYLNVTFVSETLTSFFCSSAPTKYYSDCRDVMSSNAAKMMSILNQFQNSSQFCTDIKLCPTSIQKDYITENYPFTFFKEINSEKLCETCNNITTDKFHRMADGINMDDWKSFSYNLLCQDMTDVGGCIHFTDMALEPLHEQIKSLFTKENMCHVMLKCPIKHSASNFFFGAISSFLKFQHKNSSECIMCRAISKVLEKTLFSPKITEILEHVIKTQVCEKDKPITPVCIKFMTMKSKSLLRYLQYNLQNDSLCNNMCSVSKKVETKETCKFCKNVVTDLKLKISISFDNKKWVETNVDVICQHVSKDMNKKCLQFIKVNRIRLISLLIKNKSITETCTELDQCQNKHFYYDIFNSYHEEHPHVYSSIDKKIPSSYDIFMKDEAYPFNVLYSEERTSLEQFSPSFYKDYFYYRRHNKIEKKECKACVSYRKELEELKIRYKQNPTFYMEYVILICSYNKDTENKCLLQLNNYIQENLSIFNTEKSITKLCQTSCLTLKKILFLCSYEHENYCKRKSDKKKMFFL